MEQAWENSHLDMEMDCEDDFFDKDLTDEFLRDIFLEPAENPPVFTSSSNSLLVCEDDSSKSKKPRRSSSPRTYILSFDNSTMVPERSSDAPKRASESPNTEPRSRPNYQGPKRARNSSQTTDHILAERKRRQELTERFIALSATIPGLNKTDKASVLRAAIDYVKQLKERVQELEKQEKKKGNKESVIVIKKRAPLSENEENSTITSTRETSSDACSVLPEMEAKVLGKEVLVEIHCEKQIGIDLKILDYLENLHLSVTATSVLPFGNSALCIIIIAHQMGEAYKMTVNELVKNLRVFLNSHTSDPY